MTVWLATMSDAPFCRDCGCSAKSLAAKDCKADACFLKMEAKREAEQKMAEALWHYGHSYDYPCCMSDE